MPIPPAPSIFRSSYRPNGAGNCFGSRDAGELDAWGSVSRSWLDGGMVTLPLCLEPGGEPSFRGLLGGLMTIPGGRLSKCPRRDCPLTTLRRSNPGFHARAFILFSHQHNESANE